VWAWFIRLIIVQVVGSCKFGFVMAAFINAKQSLTRE